jgi:hypothetical protein
VKVAALVLLISFFSFTVACSVTLPKAPPSYKPLPDSKLVQAPLEERTKDKLPKGTFKRKALLKDEKASDDGVLLDPRETARLGLINTERDSLRLQLLAEKRLTRKKDHIYKKALWEAEVRYIKAQPTWLERHAGKIGLAVGIIVGAGFAVGMAAAIDGVSK